MTDAQRTPVISTHTRLGEYASSHVFYKPD